MLVEGRAALTDVQRRKQSKHSCLEGGQVEEFLRRDIAANKFYPVFCQHCLLQEEVSWEVGYGCKVDAVGAQPLEALFPALPGALTDACGRLRP